LRTHPLCLGGDARSPDEPASRRALEWQRRDDERRHVWGEQPGPPPRNQLVAFTAVVASPQRRCMAASTRTWTPLIRTVAEMA